MSEPSVIGKIGGAFFELTRTLPSERDHGYVILSIPHTDTESGVIPASSVRLWSTSKDYVAFGQKMQAYFGEQSRVQDDTVYLVHAYEDTADFRLCASLVEVLRAYAEFIADDAEFMVSLNTRLHNADYWSLSGHFTEEVGGIARFEVQRLPGWAALVAGLTGMVKPL